jgi:hypothetical protein
MSTLIIQDKNYHSRKNEHKTFNEYFKTRRNLNYRTILALTDTLSVHYRMA